MIAAAAVKARGGISLADARHWLLTEHMLANNTLARDVLASLVSSEPLAPESVLWLEGKVEEGTVNSQRAGVLLRHFRASFAWGDLLSNETHTDDPETGLLVQLLSPEELRDLLDRHNISRSRPSMFVDGDQWEVAS